MSRTSVELERVFEGPEVLDALLRLAGSEATSDTVVERMREAQAQGAPPSEVIPRLFSGEPRFPSAEVARALYGNLLGLWDALAAGPMLEPARAPARSRPPKPVAPRPPEPFGAEEPSVAFVEAAWQYLAFDAQEREKRWHSFENRQDALLADLDALELSDATDAVARYLLFELHAMLELGRGARSRKLTSVDLKSEPSVEELPPALASYIEESVFEAEQDEEEPLPREEAAVARRVARAGLWALWRAGSE